jgi:hypothetical protein
MIRPLPTTLASLLLLTGAFFGAPPPVAHGDGKATPGAQDAANALKTIKIDPGLKIELWASDHRRRGG